MVMEQSVHWKRYLLENLKDYSLAIKLKNKLIFLSQYHFCLWQDVTKNMSLKFMLVLSSSTFGQYLELLYFKFSLSGEFVAIFHYGFNLQLLEYWRNWAPFYLFILLSSLLKYLFKTCRLAYWLSFSHSCVIPKYMIFESYIFCNIFSYSWVNCFAF